MPKNQFINDYLSADHKRLDIIFDSLVKGMRDNQPLDYQKSLFQLFKSGLLRHVHWEESIIYPIYIQHVGETIKPIENMVQEHRELESMIEEVERHCSEAFDLDYLMALGQYLSAHNEKEEKLLYTVMDDFSRNEIKEKIAIEISRSFK